MTLTEDPAPTKQSVDPEVFQRFIETEGYRTWQRHIPSWEFVENAAHHDEFWEWLWAMERGVRPDYAFIGCWGRGGAKSSTAEAGVAACGTRGTRRFVLYVSETQDQADDHVANIASILESPMVSVVYPEVGKRLVGKYGQSKGWRRNRIRTASGFTVDALGLDVAKRGVKIEDERPDLIVFDDIDGEGDTLRTTASKITTITKKIMPTGGDDTGYAFIQNLISETSIMARLVGRAEEKYAADFMARRYVSGPVPAIRNLEYERSPEPDPDTGRRYWVITGGEPSWPEGQGLEVCEAQINEWGPTAFESEANHDTTPPGGEMFAHVEWEDFIVEELPEMKRIVCWVDPAVTDTDDSDSHAISVVGKGYDNRAYVMWTWERRTSPEDSIKRAIMAAIRWRAEKVGIETDQGGDTWKTVFRAAVDDLVQNGFEGSPPVKRSDIPWLDTDKAGASQQSKRERAQKRLLFRLDSDDLLIYRGAAKAAVGAMKRFPETKPFDLVDSMGWGVYDLLDRGQGGVLAPKKSQRSINRGSSGGLGSHKRTIQR